MSDGSERIDRAAHWLLEALATDIQARGGCDDDVLEAARELDDAVIERLGPNWGCLGRPLWRQP